MNVKVKTIGGGIFSKVMVGIQSVSPSFDLNNLVMDIDWGRVDSKRQNKTDVNPFNWVLDQNESIKVDKIIPAGVSSMHSQFLTNKNFDIKFSGYKNVIQKLNIKKEIHDRIPNNINERTLGVHVRLTDMNKIHKQYGVLTTDSFKRKIDSVINSGDYDNIFVASDNMESIEELSKHYKIIYNDVTNRSLTEDGSEYNKFLQDNSGEKSLWCDSFLDFLTLSKCGGIIYTPSNLAIASIMYSNTIKNKYRI